MSCPSPCQDGPDSGFFSTATVTAEKIRRKEKNATAEEDSYAENVRLRSQLECLKNSLDSRTKDLRIQEELTRDLEEELDRTKLDLTSLQEKCERRDRRQKSVTINSLSDPGLSWRYGTLYCAVNKVEETLRNLSEKHSCGLSECRTLIEEEMEKIISVKNDLKNFEASKLTNESSTSGNKSTVSNPTVQLSCCDAYKSSMPSFQAGSGCTLIHLNDVEEFREKALTGASTLEEMKEQIDILENTVRKYMDEFPCECDKFTMSSCEEKLETLRSEFDEVADQLCTVIRKFHAYNLDESRQDSQSSSTCCEVRTVQESLAGLRSDSQRLRREICEQENEVEKLQDLYRQLDEEVKEKKKELFDQKRDIESKTCEVIRLRDLMEEVSRKLRGDSCDGNSPGRSPSLGNTAANLRTLFTAMRDFECLLENASETLSDGQKLEEENEELKNKVSCLEKYIRNKEETLKVLQDTVKLKECQIEEIKLKMESSENETSKLTQDVEEKCRLIANLQDAVRKCKQFEVNVRSSRIESLEFEICDLNNRLKKSEKEIILREGKLESLRNQILVLSSKNIHLHRELNVLEPRLKSMYKTCHVFEKMVNDLQEELNIRQGEVDGLCGKIRELEGELDAEFRKCESRALEDSKYIEDLSVAVKEFQQELCLARENYNVTIAETEEKFMREREMYEQKEREYREEIGELKSEIEGLRVEFEAADNSGRIEKLESMLREAESRRLGYEKRIAELENVLECTLLEHEEERKSILEKLCDEKRENVKNKTLITKLNESVKRKVAAEKNLRECVERATEDAEILRAENEELKTEVETRKNMMSAMERHENVNLSDLEELIGRLKMQKADVKSRCCSLRTELDKELKLKRVLECRVEDLNTILESKLQEFDEMVKNYKCTSSKLQQTLGKIKEAEEESSIMAENVLRPELESDDLNDCDYLKRMVDSKAAENARLFSRLLVSKVEMEALQTEYFSAQANKDCLISRLRYEASCLEKNYDVLREKWERCQEENKRLRGEMDCLVEKTTSLQAEFREKQKEMCSKLRSALCEKNDLLNSVDKLQKQLEQICLENINQEEMNRELADECSRLRINNDANESYARNKSDKIICNLSKEVKNLQRELCSVRESYDNLNVDYQNLIEEFKCLEKKKVNLEKLYYQVNSENGQLQEVKQKMEKELCEAKNQNMLLREKMAASTPTNFGPSEDTQVLKSKLKELTMKVKTFEKRIIPGLEQDIAEKSCCIENMSAEIRDANISSQRMRNEALRVIQHTKKYLAAQRCANEALKSRLECSNKRRNLLGAENRDLEEQLKAVTRMNEFLLCQLENAKTDVDVEEPPSGSTLPWSCATVERDTSSSEYLAESGIQSMQQSPTNLDCTGYDFKHDPKRTNSQWNSMKRNKDIGTSEYSSFRSNIR